jgi:hypothetical protein
MIERIKNIFLISGIYGILILFPQFFLEKKVGIDYPPPVTHSELYYGFIGVALAWQVLFIIIARDPIRFKPAMIPCMLEKAGFGFAVLILFNLGRVPSLVLFFACIDLLIMLLFIYAYRNTPDSWLQKEQKQLS